MGGGTVMRTAAKVAGVSGMIHTGLRGSPAVPSTGKSMRTASIPASATLSVDVPAIGKPVVEPIEEDGWQLLEDGELVMTAGEPLPRVVFGGAPSFKEAKEATDDLKEALDKVYLSSPATREPEAESLHITKTSVPQHAYQAFELLSRSTEAQNVVASLSSDPNVWNAMMENSAVKQFMETQKICSGQVEYASDSVILDPVSPKKVEVESQDASDSSLESMINDFVDKFKLTMSNIINNLSTFIHNIFEPPAADHGNTRNVVASGFMGLAIMVVMVVLMKRA